MAPLIRFSEKSLHRPKVSSRSTAKGFADPYSTRALNESAHGLQRRDQGG
jgi:hypothetical protein